MIRSIFRPMMRPIFRPMMRGAGAGAITRPFALFDPVQQSDLEFSEDWVAPSDFEVTLQYAGTQTAGAMFVSGGTGAGGFELYLAGGVLSILHGGANKGSTSISLTDGKLNTLLAKRVSTDVLIYKGATLIKTVSGVGGDCIIRNVGRRTGGSYYLEGVAANVKLDDLSQSGNTFTFPINTATGDVELADETTLGSEEVVNGDFALGTDGWVAVSSLITSPSDNIQVQNDGALFGRAQQTLAGLTIGKAYKVTAYVDTAGGIPAKLIFGAVSTILGSNTEGELVITFTATATSHAVQLQNNSNTSNAVVLWDNVSVKEIQGIAATYSGIPEANRDLFQFLTPVYTNISPAPQALPATIEVA
jgi:hypothetical protein